MAAIANLGDNLKFTVNDAVIVTMYARIIIKQPDFNVEVPDIPQLPTHLGKVKDHSNTWLDRVFPIIIGMISDVIQFGKMFSETYQEIIQAIPSDVSQEVSSERSINHLDSLLLKNFDGLSTAVQSVVDAIENFYQDFRVDYDLFQKDINDTIPKVITDDNAEVKQQQKVINMAQSKLRYLENKMSTNHILQGTASAAYAAIPVFGFLIGGLTSRNADSHMQALKNDYGETIKHMHDNIVKLAEMNNEAAVLAALKNELSGLETNIRDVMYKSMNVRNGWIALKQEIDDVAKYVQDATSTPATNVEQFGVLLKTRLGQAKDAWEEVVDQANLLKPPDGVIADIDAESIDQLVEAVTDHESYNMLTTTPKPDVDPLVG